MAFVRNCCGAARRLGGRWAARLFDLVLARLGAGKAGTSDVAAAVDHCIVRIDRPMPGKWTTSRSRIFVAGWAVDVDGAKASVIRIRRGRKVFYPYAKPRMDARDTVPWAPTDCGFERVVELRLGLQRLVVEHRAADGEWRPVRRLILLRLPALRRREEIPVPQTYQHWVGIEQQIDAQEQAEIEQHIAVMLERPSFAVVIDARRADGDVGATAASIRRQIYPDLTIHVLASPDMCDDPAVANTAINRDSSLAAVSDDFVVFVQAGDLLSPRALYEFAAVINAFPDLDMVYADEDVISSGGGRGEPFFKPDWSPDYLETFNYVGYAACFRLSLAQRCAPYAHDYDFVLRFSELTQAICHLPKVLYHRARGIAGDAAGRTQLDIAALAGRLERTGRSGTVTAGRGAAGCYDVRAEIKAAPLVSIIIPTAGKIATITGRKVDLIANCIAHVRARTTYANIELIVVDSVGLAADRIEALAASGCRRVSFLEPDLNIAKALNFGAAVARGKMLLLLNDDTEVITPDWIERMLEHFEKPHVGVVGAKLLYGDGRLQHAGVVHNAGNPDHARRFYPRDDTGYFFSGCGVRNYMAVTGACMMTPKDVYERVGGYSPELALNFNDLDYCMKVRAAGRHVVYAPQAELYHFESLSRTATDVSAEQRWLNTRWAAELASDPFYNERFLAVAPPTFEPCVNRRWF